MKSFDEKQQLAELEKLFKDDALHPVLMKLWDVWQLFELATLTLTHPDLPDYSREYYTQLAQQFESFVLAEFPGLTELAKACWHRGPQSPITPEMQKRLRKHNH